MPGKIWASNNLLQSHAQAQAAHEPWLVKIQPQAQSNAQAQLNHTHRHKDPGRTRGES